MFQALALISLSFLTFLGSPSKAEESIESLIQKHVVETCDKLNKPKQNTCDKRNLDPKTLPETTAQKESEKLLRCDRHRSDEPEQTQVNNFLDTPMNVSAISKEDLAQVFSYIKKQKTRYALGAGRTSLAVCNQRAEIIANDILEDCKIQSAKIFALPSRNLMTLGIAKNTLDTTTETGTYSWTSHHVANVIYVKDGDKTVPYAIDPLLFTKPVPLEDWEAAMRQVDTRASTRLTSSSTYRPSGAYEDDPSTGPRNLAQAMRDLEEYRSQSRRLQRFKE